MKQKYNVAVIGCGVISDLHIKGVKAKDCCEIYAICDNAADDRLQRQKNRYGALHAVTDYRQLVEDPEVDVVIIATPDKTHLEMTTAFLRAGKQVLLEKPMALTLAECEEMRRVEKETGNRLMVGQVARYNPVFKKAKQLVDSGAIGELVFVESEYAHDYIRSRGYNDWRVTPEREGVIGGGCHAIDYLRWVAGDPIEVFAYANHKYLTDWPVNDTTIAVYKFQNDVIGKVFCSIGVKRDYTMRTCLYGTEGTIIFEDNSTEIKFYQMDKNGNHYTVPRLLPVKPMGHNMAAEISDFMDAIVEGRPNPVESREGAATVAVCCATVESAKIGAPVKIQYPED